MTERTVVNAAVALLALCAAVIWSARLGVFNVEPAPVPIVQVQPEPPAEIGWPWWQCLYHRPTATMRWCNVITGQWGGAC